MNNILCITFSTPDQQGSFLTPPAICRDRPVSSLEANLSFPCHCEERSEVAITEVIPTCCNN